MLSNITISLIISAIFLEKLLKSPVGKVGNGNLVCVEDAYYDRSTNNGSEGAPTLRIRKIHISKDESGNESIVLTYNNLSFASDSGGRL